MFYEWYSASKKKRYEWVKDIQVKIFLLQRSDFIIYILLNIFYWSSMSADFRGILIWIWVSNLNPDPGVLSSFRFQTKLRPSRPLFWQNSDFSSTDSTFIQNIERLRFWKYEQSYPWYFYSVSIILTIFLPIFFGSLPTFLAVACSHGCGSGWNWSGSGSYSVKLVF